MVQEALPILRGRTLLDSTSGNTGIAYAWIGAALKIPVALVMPENVSEARKRIARHFGARIIFSDPLEQSDGAIRLARQLAEEEPERWFYIDQYSNEANPRAHEAGTAPEIWEQTAGRVTHAVIGIGTGGTIMGTGRGLKARNRNVEVIAVEPAEALHGLEGLKHMPSSIVPRIYKESELDRKLSIATDLGWDMAERLIKEEDLLAGHSAGAAACGASSIPTRTSGPTSLVKTGAWPWVEARSPSGQASGTSSSRSAVARSKGHACTPGTVHATISAKKRYQLFRHFPEYRSG